MASINHILKKARQPQTLALNAPKDLSFSRLATGKLVQRVTDMQMRVHAVSLFSSLRFSDEIYFGTHHLSKNVKTPLLIVNSVISRYIHCWHRWSIVHCIILVYLQRGALPIGNRYANQENGRTEATGETAQEPKGKRQIKLQEDLGSGEVQLHSKEQWSFIQYLST